MIQLSGWILVEKTVKSGWKSILDSSARTTDVNNGIVMQSIIHSFSANHHLFLVWSLSRQFTETEAGQDEGHHRAHRPFR